jgi:MFS family permease
MSSQFGLLKTRRFAPFFGTQFLGAFNDNLYKNALVVLLLPFQAASWTTLAPGGADQPGRRHLHPALLPVLGDRRPVGRQVRQGKLARLTKLLEIVIMGVALLGFMMHSLEVLLAGAVPARAAVGLFGPVKYAILPQHLHEMNWSAATRWSSPGLSSPS